MKKDWLREEDKMNGRKGLETADTGAVDGKEEVFVG